MLYRLKNIPRFEKFIKFNCNCLQVEKRFRQTVFTHKKYVRSKSYVWRMSKLGWRENVEKQLGKIEQCDLLVEI